MGLAYLSHGEGWNGGAVDYIRLGGSKFLYAGRKNPLGDDFLFLWEVERGIIPGLPGEFYLQQTALNRRVRSSPECPNKVLRRGHSDAAGEHSTGKNNPRENDRPGPAIYLYKRK